MLAILAAICFLLVMFGVAAPVNLLALGLVLLSAHLIYPYTPWARRES